MFTSDKKVLTRAKLSAGDGLALAVLEEDCTEFAISRLKDAVMLTIRERDLDFTADFEEMTAQDGF